MQVTSLPTFDRQQIRQLIEIARQAIRDYFAGINQPPTVSHFDTALQQSGACFVTLEVNHQLQGCLGSLIAHTPLVEEVYEKARSAAYQDHRFLPLEPAQLAQLTIEVSVLSPLTALAVKDEQTLLEYLRDNPVGVVLSEGMRRAVFLPQVWKQLPQPADFLHHLKIKGGWASWHWSDSMKVEIFNITSAKESFMNNN